MSIVDDAKISESILQTFSSEDFIDTLRNCTFVKLGLNHVLNVIDHQLDKGNGFQIDRATAETIKSVYATLQNRIEKLERIEYQTFKESLYVRTSPASRKNL
ncbi:hypothetical protein ACSYG2_04370 [Leptospira interrogans serovar Icterohaemorrhagiae]|uniref:hypothetical protein n=1 Tax=Leptospira interrogans TaxID=173 RepID=UPI0002B94D67|nr:hypothetical protein [Leptospira interrogans]QOI33588.1 hypothetical protein LeptoLang_04695 [Leptospira interrogans serovar Icterohaemorrhagiae]